MKDVGTTLILLSKEALSREHTE